MQGSRQFYCTLVALYFLHLGLPAHASIPPQSPARMELEKGFGKISKTLAKSFDSIQKTLLNETWKLMKYFPEIKNAELLTQTEKAVVRENPQVKIYSRDQYVVLDFEDSNLFSEGLFNLKVDWAECKSRICKPFVNATLEGPIHTYGMNEKAGVEALDLFRSFKVKLNSQPGIKKDTTEMNLSLVVEDKNYRPLLDRLQKLDLLGGVPDTERDFISSFLNWGQRALFSFFG